MTATLFEVTHKDISKKEKAEAQLASRKLLKQLKEIAPEVYDRIKIEL